MKTNQLSNQLAGCAAFALLLEQAGIFCQTQFRNGELVVRAGAAYSEQFVGTLQGLAERAGMAKDVLIIC